MEITNEYDFEKLCCKIAQYKYNDFDVQFYGRRGQDQAGIDIKARDRRNGDEPVVIQCKYKIEKILFKTKRISERNKIIKEINNDLKKALKKHTFKKFVYAAYNVVTDTVIQDYAEKLSESANYEVVVWFHNDILKDIEDYPKIKSVNNPIVKNEIINSEFIRIVKKFPEGFEFNVYNFYSGVSDFYTQWLGVLNEFDAKRECYDKLVSTIEASFEEKFTSKKVAALVIGEGGSGKSTLLRRLAIDNVLEKRGYVNWWIEDLDTFLSTDISLIEGSKQDKHLVIIEDWYRNFSRENSKDVNNLFKSIANLHNIRLVIGNRPSRKNEVYLDHVLNKNKFELKAQENIDILKEIAGKRKDAITWKNAIEQITENPTAYQNLALFEILFVLAHIIKDDNTRKLMGQNMGSIFEKLVAKKIKEIEDNANYNGLGKAMYIAACLYTHPKMNFRHLRRKTIYRIADYFNSNNNKYERLLHSKNHPAFNGNYIQDYTK